MNDLRNWIWAAEAVKATCLNVSEFDLLIQAQKRRLIQHSSETARDSTRCVQLDRCTYEVVGQRRGGMGTVWLLRRPAGAPSDTIYGPTRAAKTFNAREDEQEATVEQELGNWAALNHQRIVPLIKICRLNFELAALMEQMSGSLGEYLRRHQGSLDEATVITVMLDVLHGLNYAHRERNIAHLDLKPENLLLGSLESPRVKISDWGLSRIMSNTHQHADWLRAPDKWLSRQTEEKTSFAWGTYPYMAPERFSGSWSIGPPADVFSLGMIGVQLLTGRLPSVDTTDAGPLLSIRLITTNAYLERAKKLLASTSRSLAEQLLKMLEPCPDQRPQDYSALIKGFQALAEANS